MSQETQPPYYANYKCRRCETLLTPFASMNLTPNELVNASLALATPTGSFVKGFGMRGSETHLCNDGELGLIDFVGFSTVSIQATEQNPVWVHEALKGRK